MQRPTRILVIGLLCLVFGFFSGLVNLAELSLCLIGPEILESVLASAKTQGQDFSEANLKNVQVQIAALRQPGYRVMLGVESFSSTVMAGLLIVAGIALLRGAIWSIKLAKGWAWYALFASVLAVVLQTRYLLPEMDTTHAPPGSEVIGAACMLPVLWAFPVTILTVLGRPIVMDYLKWRASSRQLPLVAQAPLQPVSGEHQARLTKADDLPGPTVSEPTPRISGPTQADQTWRDDPWNNNNP